MIDLNKILIVGRLTRDPEFRSTTTGKSIASFSIAVDDGYGENKKAFFFDVKAWEKQAEFAKNYLRKGTAVFIEGKLAQETWEDKESGQKRSKAVILAHRLCFAESKAEAEGRLGESKPAEPKREPVYEQQSAPDDGLPF